MHITLYCLSKQHWPEEGCCGHTVCLAPVSSDEKKMRPALVQPNVDTIMRWVEHPGWSKREQEDLAGFKITPSATHHDSLSLSLWPRALLSKSMLIKHGYAVVGESRSSFVQHQYVAYGCLPYLCRVQVITFGKS